MGDRIAAEYPFDQATLAENWVWVREQNKDWRIVDGEIHICTRPGSIMGDSNNAENLLSRALYDKSNGFSVHVSCELLAPYEQAGLLWYYDDDNYIKLVKELVGEGLSIVMVREEQGIASVLGVIPFNGSESVKLRLLKEDTVVTGQFKMSAETGWITAAQCETYTLPGLHAGLFTHGGVNDAERWARFTDFRFLL